MAGVQGQRVAASERYAPELLDPIRWPESVALACLGWDVWHVYEVSWCVGGEARHWLGWLTIPADSLVTVETEALT